MSPKSKFVSFFLSIVLILTQLALPVLANDSGLNIKPDTITGTLIGKTVLGEAGKILSPEESNARPRVSDVGVRITNTETGVSRAMRTDAQGEYRFALVPMGNYRVEVFKEGYYVANEEAISSRIISIKLNDRTPFIPNAQMVQGIKPQPTIAATPRIRPLMIASFNGRKEAR